MNHIDPEDFEWSDEFNPEKCNDEKCVTVKSFCGSINDGHYSLFANTRPLNEEKIEIINSMHLAEEKCYTSLGESEIKLPYKNSFAELKCLTRNYSGDALNCLYRSEEQSFDLDNVMKQETKGNYISSSEEPFNNNKSSTVISNNSKTLKSDCSNALLNAETISLISNSINGVYEPPESFSSINYSSKEHEQIVPNSNYITFDENKDPQASFDFPNQEENIFINEHTSENNETSNSPKITKYVDSISNTNVASSDGELLEISAYTLGGQCYRLPKRSHLCSKTKLTINENQLEVAALLNSCKQMRQIQGGISIPETLDYNKEEDFYKWLREEKDKTKHLFENFSIKLNIKHLTAERELIKLDRHLKQYTMSGFLDPVEILELIEKTDVDLTNLVFIHQVFETLSKITKNSKGRLRVKSRAVLMKLKSLLSLPKGIKVEKYLNDLLIKNNVSKLKPEAPIEWMIHLLNFL